MSYQFIKPEDLSNIEQFLDTYHTENDPEKIIEALDGGGLYDCRIIEFLQAILDTEQ